MAMPDLARLHSTINNMIGGRDVPLVADHLRMNLQSADAPLTLNLHAVVRKHVHFVLERNRGNKLKTARQLGISRSTLYRMLEQESSASR